MQHFDAIIIGAGQAGPSLAARLTEAGQTVAFVERHLFGGTCVNTGCTPTKAMVASAYAAHTARRANDFGVSIDTTVEVDIKAVKCPARRSRHTLPQRRRRVSAQERAHYRIHRNRTSHLTNDC